jgi:hypothetical protein
MREELVHSSSRLTNVTWLFVATAAIESGAGLTLLVAPAVVVRLVFGSAADLFPAVGVARLTGAALLSLGAACWWARHDGPSAASQALLGALLIYNAAVVALSLLGALGALGPLLWAAVVLHGVQAIWCAWVVVDRRRL